MPITTVIFDFNLAIVWNGAVFGLLLGGALAFSYLRYRKGRSGRWPAAIECLSVTVTFIAVTTAVIWYVAGLRAEQPIATLLHLTTRQ